MSRYSHSHPDDADNWDAPVVLVPAFPSKCKCSHAESQHYRDRKGRPTCGSSVCGCVEFRPEPPERAIPARFDERYDPSPEPIDRKTR